MIGIVAVRSSAVESNPKYQAAVKAQQEKEKKAKEPIKENKIHENPKIVKEVKKAKKPRIYKNEIHKIISNVAEEHGLKYENIVGRSRTNNVVLVREMAMAAVFLAKPNMSLNAIGKHFGNRNHATVLHSLRKMGVR